MAPAVSSVTSLSGVRLAHKTFIQSLNTSCYPHNEELQLLNVTWFKLDIALVLCFSQLCGGSIDYLYVPAYHYNAQQLNNYLSIADSLHI